MTPKEMVAAIKAATVTEREEVQAALAKLTPTGPIGATNLSTKKFYSGKDGLIQAAKERAPEDKIKVAPGDYSLDLSIDGKVVPVTVSVDVP